MPGTAGWRRCSVGERGDGREKDRCGGSGDQVRPDEVGLWEPSGEDQLASVVRMDKEGWRGGDRASVHVSLGVG